ncbi:MAG: hypothetical protein SF162_15850 [bacterium]|nr:hypothetical protein [bacterium]
MKVISSRPIRHFGILIGLIVCSMAFKLHRIDDQSIWFDEGYSWNAAVQPTMITAANADSTNPPVYYALLHPAVALWGDSAFALRFFSLIFTLPLIPLAYRLAIRISQPAYRHRAGWSAALLAGLLPSLWWAAQEARMYALMALLVLICALAFDHLLAHPSRRTIGIVCACELTLLYTHNAAPVIAFWLNFSVLSAWFMQRSSKRIPLTTWAAGQAITLGLWLPYFVGRFLNLSGANASVSSAPVPSLELLTDLWASFWVVPYERAAAGTDGLILPLAIALVCAVAAWDGIRRAPRIGWMFAHVAVLTFGVVAALIVLGNEFHGRYLVMIAPLLAVGLGAAAGQARRAGGVLAVSLAAFSVYGIVSAWNPASPFRHDDARGMVRHYAETLTAADTVIAWSYADRYELAYYWPREQVQAARLTLPEGADLEQIAPLLPASGDTALNVWYTQRADYRGMMGCLLEHGTHAPPEVFTTYGMTSLTFRSPSPPRVTFAPVDAAFNDPRSGDTWARLVSTGALPAGFRADQAACVPLELRLTRPLAVDLKAALVVTDAAGEPLAAGDALVTDDAIFATADQRTTSAAQPGELMRAFPSVRLPAGAPAGAYTVWVRVYDEAQHPGGLVPTGAGLTIRNGRSIAIGRWKVESAAWPVPPYDPAAAIAITPELTLIAVEGVPPPESPVRNGERFRLALAWLGEGTLPAVTLAAQDGSWEGVFAGAQRAEGGYVRETRWVQVDSDAPTGTAEVRIGERIIATFTVESLPFVDTLPPLERTYDHQIGEIGVLAGVNGLAGRWTVDDLPDMTLIWQALSASQQPYIVFVQVIGADGRVIAQSDSAPGGGTRPTTGWRAGEIVTDVHTLTANGTLVPGDADVIAGMYDPVTGERLRFADGRDHVVLGRVRIE